MKDGTATLTGTLWVCPGDPNAQTALVSRINKKPAFFTTLNGITNDDESLQKLVNMLVEAIWSCSKLNRCLNFDPTVNCAIVTCRRSLRQPEYVRSSARFVRPALKSVWRGFAQTAEEGLSRAQFELLRSCWSIQPPRSELIRARMGRPSSNSCGAL